MGEKQTCATCTYIGKTYHGHADDWGGKMHTCKKEPQRRADVMKPSGDSADDFMRNFRAFFDAKAGQTACRYHEERPALEGEEARVLGLLSEQGGRSAFGFFSAENRICEGMSGRFVERDEYAGHRRAASDGTQDWMLTELGKHEAKRIAVVSEKA